MGTRQTEPLALIKYAGATLSGLRPVSNRHSSRELSAHDFTNAYLVLFCVQCMCVSLYGLHLRYTAGSCSVEAVWHVACSQMLMYPRQKNVYIKKSVS